MTLTIQLDPTSLFHLTRIASRYARRLQRKLVSRLIGERQFAVWEMPYDNPDATKAFIEGLKNTFPPALMQETLLFVNNRKGQQQCFIAAGFPETLFPQVQPVLTNFVGVIQNFAMSPELLIAMAINGHFEMATHLTPVKVDDAYGRDA